MTVGFVNNFSQFFFWNFIHFDEVVYLDFEFKPQAESEAQKWGWWSKPQYEGGKSSTGTDQFFIAFLNCLLLLKEPAVVYPTENKSHA